MLESVFYLCITILSMMSYGVCNIAMIPVRKEPSHKSELVSQLLFGEPYFIDDQLGEWLLIRCGYDAYPGWIHQNQHLPVSRDEFYTLNTSQTIVTGSSNTLTDALSGIRFAISPGSSLPGMHESRFTIGNQTFLFDGEHQHPGELNDQRNELIRNSRLFLNAPYLWGGRSITGIDCSGFVQVLFKMSGIKLPRDASMQAETGSDKHFISDAEPGDLLFFDNAEGQIVHTGMLLNHEHIIHASGKVRIDRIDHHGIFITESGKYSHKLRLIKKII